jgi:hypothetical protein
MRHLPGLGNLPPLPAGLLTGTCADVQNSAGTPSGLVAACSGWLPSEAGDDAARMGPTLTPVHELRERREARRATQPGSLEGHHRAIRYL